MRFLKLLLFIFSAVAFCNAQAGGSGDAAKSDTPQNASVGFSASMLDKSIDPCTNFYAYACSKWQAQNPIPGDRPSWGRFNELADRGEYIVRDILQKYSANDPSRSSVQQKIGDYYQACADESSIESAGTRPLESELKAVSELRSKQDLAKEVIHLHREGTGALFSFTSDQDFKDAAQVIAEADQGGMALPDRDYYLKNDTKSVELRKQYVAHVQKMFELLGDSTLKAAAEAKTVMDIETGLAKGALDRTSRRDPNKVYHKMTAQELAALSPGFGWEVYLQGIGAPSAKVLN